MPPSRPTSRAAAADGAEPTRQSAGPGAGATVAPGPVARGGQRTHRERTLDSRQRILDATVDCLVRYGYAGTTTLVIQAEAGVSRGRLLHHFPSREVLLVAATQHLVTTRLTTTWEHFGKLLDELPDGAARLDRAVEMMWFTFHQPYFWAAMELWTAARTNEALREALAPAERRLGAAIRTAAEGAFGPALASRETFPQVRELLMTSMRGAAMTYGFDPRTAASDPHLPQWKQMARQLLGL
ncbi:MULTISPECIES: TetR/AcrR family transcriptional regulator [Protofrankia]|uniref:Regulatory protein TetR n=1 Tax=Candidatus Protofrankia datiscae TaxID=2716812 RepID=F8B4C5_9ACTN|nr:MULTISPECIES: TetR/AcrR family transcriptional regulator [Protofrankia]AEH09536.1 regulatory protein TetR [Candidatus Protofrankia datiscae]